MYEKHANDLKWLKYFIRKYKRAITAGFRKAEAKTMWPIPTTQKTAKIKM